MVVSWRIGGRSERLVGSRLSGGLRRHRVFRFDGIWLCVQKWGWVVVTGGSLLLVRIFFFFVGSRFGSGEGGGLAKGFFGYVTNYGQQGFCFCFLICCY
jgi:hypothetical protein